MYSFTWTRDKGNIDEVNPTREEIDRWSTIGDWIQYCLVRTNTPGEDEQQLCHIQGSMSLLMGKARYLRCDACIAEAYSCVYLQPPERPYDPLYYIPPPRTHDMYAG